MISNFSRLYQIVRPSGRRRLVLVLALVVLQALMQTLAVFSLLPLLAAAADMNRFRASAIGGVFIQALGGGSDRQLLVWAGVIALAVLVIGNLVALFAEYSRSSYAYMISHRLKMDIVRALMSRRYEYFTHASISLLVKNLIDDSNTIASQLVMPALEVLARSILVILLLMLVIFIDPSIIIVGGAMVAVYYLFVVRPVHRRAERVSETIKHEIRGMYRQVYELLTAVKPIMAAERKSTFIGRLEDVSRATSLTFAKLPMFSAIPRSALEVIVFGGMIVWVLVALLRDGSLIALLPRMGVVAVVAYRLMPSVQGLFAQIAGMAAARQALDEVTTLMDEQAKWSGSDIAADPITPLHWEREVRFENVSFTYAGTTEPVIRDVSFTVKKGERVAIVGATGSGKSTLVDLFLGLLVPSEGRMLVDGKALAGSDLFAWRRALGYVPQELFLMDATIAENIAFGFEMGVPERARVVEVAELAQALEFIEDGRSDAFDSTVGERGVRLSGGQRQRLALARALYDRPSTLVLDEATSALDPRTEQKVVEALARGQDHLTVLTVTHRLGTVTHYDCIYYVEQGRIVASGDYASLIERDARFRAFAE